MASSTIQYKPAKLIAGLKDLELVGKVDKKRDYFVVVHIDDEEVARSNGRYGLAPLRWQEDHRIEFHPSSTIKLSLFRHSIFPLRRPYEIGLHKCNVTKLLENNNVTARLDLAEGGSTTLAGLNVKISLITDPAEDIVRHVDADLARLKDNNVITNASGKVDNAMAIAQAGGQAVKLLGSCVEPLGKALQLFVKVMDGVADAHPFVKVSWTVISSVYKTVQAQIIQDAAVLNLAELLREMVGVAAEFPDLLKVKGTTDVIEKISRASVEVALLIDEYTRHSFVVRAARFQITDDMKSRIGRCENNCRDLIEKFDRRVGMGTSKAVKKLDAVVQDGFSTLKDDALAKDISKWLNAPDSSRNYNDARKKHQASTGSWFVDSKAFSEWKNSGRFLCLYGKAGCGKTILCSSIIADVVDICMKKESSTCAYFFFDGRDAQSTLQRHDGFIRSLIQQFLDKCDGIPAPLVQLYGKGHQQPSTEALEDVLEKIRGGLPDSYIIVDSLDECAERKELLKWINKVASSQTGNLHLLVTSRPEEDIKSNLRPFEPASIAMEEGSVNDDIETYIDEKMGEGRLGAWPKDVRSKIKHTLTVKAQGMFRWLAMQLEELQNCFDVAELEDQLERLPKDLDETYSRILERVPEQRRISAKIFLQWTAFSASPPSLEELCESAAVEFDQDGLPKYNPRRRFQTRDVLATCGSLIIESYGSVKLAHFSVKEYLISDRIANGAAKHFHINERLSHSLIAETCLAYLLQLDSPRPLRGETLAAAQLANYAASNWVFHVRSCGGDGFRDIYKRITALLESGTQFDNWIALWNPDRSNFRILSKISTTDTAEPLYCASILGFTRVARQLLQHGANVDGLKNSGKNTVEKSSYMLYGSALQAACRRDHVDIVELLIKSGANVNLQGGAYGCALQAAALNGHEAIVRFLLESGADVNMQGGTYGCALQAASYDGHEATVRFLLESGADVNMQGGEYGCALQAAAYNGHEAIVRFLLESGAEVNMQGGEYGCALQAAAFEGNLAIVQLLLDLSAEVNAQGGIYGSPLQAASLGGHTEIVKLLLENKADVRAREGLTGNPLQAACIDGDLAMVKFLLENNADIHARGGIYGGPLQAASCEGNLEVVRFLLENHVDINARGGCYGNALMAALIEGHNDVVALLLENNVDVKAPARDYSSILKDGPHDKMAILQISREKEADADLKGEYVHPLQAALHNSDTDIANKLLDHGADFNARGGKYGGALQAAAFRSTLDIIQSLVDLGADVNIEEGVYGSPLQAASLVGNLEIVKFLLANHADVNVQGGPLKNALQSACFMGHLQIVKLLLENTANVNAQGGCYGNALMAASIKGYDDVVELLLENHADVNTATRDCSSIMIDTADPSTVTKLYREKEADVDFKGEYVHVLQAASYLGHTKIVKIFIDHGADVNAQGGTYGTSLQAATEGGHDEIVKLLLEHGATPPPDVKN